jgi:hypothetical protein
MNIVIIVIVIVSVVVFKIPTVRNSMPRRTSHLYGIIGTREYGVGQTV